MLTVKKPRLLDLFSGAGGCAKGYQRAGFYVVGVDNRPMPRYCGDEFHQGDALEFLAEHGHEFDVIHASPPCQAYSRLPDTFNRSDKPDLIGQTRRLLIASEKPYVIENVAGAPLGFASRLCGSMFGMKTYRHRFFESSALIMTPPHRKHRDKCPPAGRRRIAEGGMISVCGHISQMAYARKVMGIDWMTRDELAQAIPPVYTEFIGRQLFQALAS